MKGGKELTEEDVLSFLGYINAFISDAYNQLGHTYHYYRDLLKLVPKLRVLPHLDQYEEMLDVEWRALGKLDKQAVKSAVACLADSAITNAEDVLGMKWLDVKSWLEAYK